MYLGPTYFSNKEMSKDEFGLIADGVNTVLLLVLPALYPAAIVPAPDLF